MNTLSNHCLISPFNLQLQLAIDPDQPLFSNLVQQDSGIVTAGGYRSASTGSSTAGDQDITDQYESCNNVSHVRALLQDAVEEYNKGQPKIRISLYRVRRSLFLFFLLVWQLVSGAEIKNLFLQQLLTLIGVTKLKCFHKALLHMTWAVKMKSPQGRLFK